jgi:hypothetical protein
MSLRAKDVSSSREETRGPLLPSLASLGVGTGMPPDQLLVGWRDVFDVCREGDATTLAAWLRDRRGAACAAFVASLVFEDGRTPLHLACQPGLVAFGTGHLRCVATLLALGMDTNARNTRVCGWTPLHRACSGGHADCVRLLLEAGAKVNVRDTRGMTPLHYACQTIDNRCDCARLLLQHGADTNLKEGRRGWTPLHFACSERDLILVALLLQCGADVHARNNRDQTPLVLACYHQSAECTEILLEAGASVHDTDGIVALGDRNWVEFASYPIVSRARRLLEREQTPVGGRLSLAWTSDTHELLKESERWAVHRALRALLLAEARRAGCELSWDAAERVLQAAASR